MKVVLDTNVIVRRRFWLSGPHVAVLERAIALGAVELVIPQIVTEELVNKYREFLERAYRQTAECTADLNSLLASDNQLVSPTIDLDITVKAFASAFDERVNELNVACPTYGDIPHSDVLRRDLARCRPFQESGRGYRDALLWETVLRKVASKTDEVVLITEDAENFWQDKKSCVLHQHLSNDLQRLGLSPNSVSLSASLEAFVDDRLKALLPTNEEVLQTIKDGDYDLFQFSEFFQERRSEIAREIQSALERAQGMPFGLPTEMEEIEVEYLEDPSSEEVSEAYELDEERLFLSYDVVADINLNFFLSKSDYYVLEEETEFSVRQSDWSDHYMWCSKTVKLPFRISIVLRLGPKDRVESFDVDLPEFYGWCWRCRTPILSDAAEGCPQCQADLLKPHKSRR